MRKNFYIIQSKDGQFAPYTFDTNRTDSWNKFCRQPANRPKMKTLGYRCVKVRIEVIK